MAYFTKKPTPNYKYKDTNLPEKVLTDEFFIVHLLLLFPEQSVQPEQPE